jgi:hypothetical protein
MPGMGFEPTMPALERAQTFHALDRAATVSMKLLRRENSNLWPVVQAFALSASECGHHSALVHCVPSTL